jgi:uncharacterized membrane protein/protein-disulfide isomerase
MSTTVRRVLSLLAVVGLASALGSLYVHLRMLSHPGYLSFCDVSAFVSCTHVYQSPYATLAGVPVALLGALWYVAVLVLLAGARWGWPELRESAPGYVFVLSTFGLAFVLYMAYASLVLLKIVCLLCVVTYVAVAAIFVISGTRTPYSMITIPRRLLQDAKAAVRSPVALVSILALVVAATSAVAFFPREGAVTGQAASGRAGANPQSEFLRFWDAQPRVPVPVSSEGASVLIVRFSDYQCPSCGQTYLGYKPLFERYSAQYPGTIKLVVKDFPLQTECNPNVSRDVHLASCAAAAAARMARARGRGDAMEEWLYTNQATLTPASVRDGARQVGGVTDFDAQYPAVLNQVKTDVALAAVLGIRVTPTFFICSRKPGESGVTGIKLEGGLPPQYFELAIQQELKRAGKTP